MSMALGLAGAIFCGKVTGIGCAAWLASKGVCKALEFQQSRVTKAFNEKMQGLQEQMFVLCHPEDKPARLGVRNWAQEQLFTWLPEEQLAKTEHPKHAEYAALKGKINTVIQDARKDYSIYDPLNLSGRIQQVALAAITLAAACAAIYLFAPVSAGPALKAVIFTGGGFLGLIPAILAGFSRLRFDMDYIEGHHGIM